MSFQQTELHAANQALAAGNIERAIGHIRSLAAFLNVELPRPPIPASTAYANYTALERYFFLCKSIIGSHVNTKADNIRASLGNPISVRVKPKVKGSNGSATA